MKALWTSYGLLTVLAALVIVMEPGSGTGAGNARASLRTPIPERALVARWVELEPGTPATLHLSRRYDQVPADLQASEMRARPSSAAALALTTARASVGTGVGASVVSWASAGVLERP